MNKWLKVILIIFIIVTLVLIAWKYFRNVTDNPNITESEVNERVEKVYSAVVKDIEESEKVYSITFEKEDGIYNVFLNKKNGQFTGLTKIEDKNNITKDFNKPNPNESNKKDEIPNKNDGKVLLSEQEAISIALKELPGTVDDVDFEKTIDGGYYLIEIERGEEEAEIQIHAVTGKILSVKFDD